VSIPDRTCRCPRWGAVRCTLAITQEDLLCDGCRSGCATVYADLAFTQLASVHCGIPEVMFKITGFTPGT
jgi:hypothetical protein